MQQDFNSMVINKLFDVVIGALIFSLFILPFIIIASYFPVSKFYSEISAVYFALLLTTILVFRSKLIHISSVAIACFVFSIWLLLQIIFVDIRFPGINIGVALQIGLMALFSIGISSASEHSSESRIKIINSIMWAALCGATIQAIIGYMQYTGVAADYSNFLFYMNSDSANLFGNIGQRNQFVDFVSIGCFALAYLYFVRKVNVWIFIFYSLFFASIMTLAAARTVFGYFFVAIIIGSIFIFINRKNSHLSTEFKRLMFILVAMFVGLMIVEVSLPSLLAHATSGLSRMGNGVDQSTYRRFYEWYKELVIFIQHPVFGIGWYQYPRDGIYIMLTDTFSYIPANRALFTHSHNSVLNVLAETGIVGFLIFWVYGFGYGVYRILKTQDNYQSLFIIFMLFCIFIHSNFEYPLWYAYFVVLFVLFLSLSKGTVIIKNSIGIKSIFALVFVGFTVFTFYSSAKYENLVRMTQSPTDDDDFKKNVDDLKQIIDNDTLWSLYALMVLDNYNTPGTPAINMALSMSDQVKYVDMLANQLPYPGALLKQVIVHKISGDDAGALFYAKLLAHAYPFYKEQFIQQFSSGGPQFTDVVNEINNFQYEDKSYFAKHFKKDSQ